MNHLSLFSGIGGLDLAAEWAGFRTIGFVERDKFCQRVLAKHWPGVPIWDDVAEVSAYTLHELERAQQDQRQDQSGQQAPRRDHVGRLAAPRVGIDLISGGFPCQPHSVAGKRQASADERDLWSECARIVGEFRPRWCVFENVPGLLSSEGGSFFARVIGDLAALGYGVGWATYGAVDVGAPHRRDRVFIVANADQERRVAEAHFGQLVGDRLGIASNSDRGGLWEFSTTGGWQSEPDVGRVAHGIPRRVDRLRALGNAVVPQQAYPIFRAIAEIEGMYRG
jgi:DNA (cytosine-5)-methyltransferase 1